MSEPQRWKKLLMVSEFFSAYCGVQHSLVFSDYSFSSIIEWKEWGLRIIKTWLQILTPSLVVLVTGRDFLLLSEPKAKTKKKAMIPALLNCSENLRLCLIKKIYTKTRHVCSRFMSWIMSPQRSYVEVLTPVPKSVTILGDRIFTEVIKLTWDHWERGWNPNDWCPYKSGNFGHRDWHKGKTMWRDTGWGPPVSQEGGLEHILLSQPSEGT